MTIEQKIEFYENHLKRLDENKDRLNYAFYTSEKEAVRQKINQLKEQLNNITSND